MVDDGASLGVVIQAVIELAGDRYRRTDSLSEYVRWWRQCGSVYWIKLPISYAVSRVGLGTWRYGIAHISALANPRAADVGLFGTMLQG